jgi:glutathione synthase/RimK-type ligase-like ATP-grasp enzyme
MIVKPVVGSGSRGVALVRNRTEMLNVVGEDSSKWMIQECVNGIFYRLSCSA